MSHQIKCSSITCNCFQRKFRLPFDVLFMMCVVYRFCVRSPFYWRPSLSTCKCLANETIRSSDITSMPNWNLDCLTDWLTDCIKELMSGCLCSAAANCPISRRTAWDGEECVYWRTTVPNSALPSIHPCICRR